MQYLTSDDLIASVKRRAMIPQSQNVFQDADFLAFANEEMNLGMVPSVLRANEDYFMFHEDIPLVSGTNKYEIPYRSIGNKTREIAYIDNNGNVFEMTRIMVEDLPDYNGSYQSQPYAYYISNNEICLTPANQNTQYAQGTILRVTYYIRPNSLVLLKNVAPITSIDRTTGEIQVSNLPSNYSANNKFDLVKVKSPHKCVKIELTAVSLNSTTKTVTFNINDIPPNLEVGDHVCIATESAIPQVPSDLHVMLAHRVAARCLEALGDAEGLAAANQKLAEFEQQTAEVIHNRVEGAAKKVVARHGTLRNGLVSRRNRFRS